MSIRYDDCMYFLFLFQATTMNFNPCTFNSCIYISCKVNILSLQISPEISEGNSPYVHHTLIYLCAELNHTFVGASGVCEDTHLAIQSCQRGGIIASWAVGGNVRNNFFNNHPQQLF